MILCPTIRIWFRTQPVNIQRIKWIYAILTICVLNLVNSYAIQAQSLAHWRITNEDGLPSMTVYSLIQDSSGYIWFGTANGIARYDGNQFKKYKIPGAYNADISYLNQDKYGRVWGKNFSGGLFYVEKDSMVLFNHTITQNIQDYYLSADSVFYIVGKNLKAKPLNDLSSKEFSFGQISDLNGRAHLAGKEGDNLLILGGQKMLIYNLRTAKSNSLKINYQQGVYQKNESFFFWRMSSYDRVSLWNAESGISEYTITGIERSIFITNIKKHKEHIYITTKSGMYKCVLKGSEIQVLKHYFKGQFLSNLLFDTENNLWVTTLRNGVMLIPDIYSERYDNNSNFGLRRVTCILGIDSLLFIGGEQGRMQQMNCVTKKVINYHSIGSEDIRAIEYDAISNKLYTIGNNFAVFNPLQEKPIIIHDQYPYKDVDITSTQQLIIGTSVAAIEVKKENALIKNGVSLINTTNKNGLDNPFKVLRKRRVFHVLSHKSNRLVAYDDQLIFYADSVEIPILFEGKNIIIRQMKYNSIKDCYTLLTYNNGLLELKTAKGIMKTFQAASASMNYSSFEIGPSCYYLGAGKQLYTSNYTNNEVNELNFWGGLEPGEVYTVVRQAEDLWIGTNKGLYKRNTIDSVKKNTIAPKVFIQNIEVNGVSKHASNMSYKYNENKWVFSVVGIAYKSKLNYQLRYRLKGLSETWEYAPSRSTEIEFSSLPPGKYTFEVVAENESGVKSLAPAQFAFEIKAPFWTRWWFISLVGITLILITTLIVWRFYRIKIRHKNEQLQRAQTERQLRQSQLAAVKSQMNPHFIFNALNSIQDYIIRNEKRLANNYLGMFADLMRQTLELSNQELVTIKEELDLLRIYIELESLRFEENDFHYSISITEGIDLQKVKIPPLLIQPYVENAIKHGLFHKPENKHLTILVAQENQQLKITIEDNGIGREKAQHIKEQSTKPRNSFSTKANEQRLDLINFGRTNKVELYFEDLHLGDSGTRVILLIPNELEH